MSEKVRITYLDGRVETVTIGPRALVECERHLKGLNSSSALEGSYWTTWWSATKAGVEDDSFEEWLDKIEDTETIPEDDEESDPTTGATTTDGTSDTPTLIESSPSQSPPESPSTD